MRCVIAKYGFASSGTGGQAKGVWGLGWNSDMGKFGGDAQLAAAVLHWDPIYEKVLKDVAANKWTNAPIYYGVKEGTVNVENIGKQFRLTLKNGFGSS